MTLNMPFEGFKSPEMPHGISSAPEVFQRLISEFFERLQSPDIVINDD